MRKTKLANFDSLFQILNLFRNGVLAGSPDTEQQEMRAVGCELGLSIVK